MELQKLVKRKNKALTDGNKSSLISTCITLAETYFKEGQYLSAINEYKIVAEKYKEMNKQIDFGRANRMIGEAYVQLHEYNKALKHQQVHLEISRNENDKLEEQRALATIGHIYLTNYLNVVDNPDKNSLNLAYKSFMKSLVICEGLIGISKHEHMDMSARLFANLGIVQESLGDYNKGIELIQKCVNICKSHDIYEQLERAYTILGSLYTKKNDYSNAINHYNLAIDVAGRLDEKIVLKSASLLAKADILIKLSDFYSAKTVLLKAYKLKTPNKTEYENIERNLKIVTAMCYTEDSLLTIGDTDYKTKKKLYEKMGDGACALKNFPKAIEYYKKMLEAALSNGDNGINLCPCYESLGQTYMDNKQYALSIEYFKKDYELHVNDLKEGVITLFSIADAMNLSGVDLSKIHSIYEEAINKCKRFNDRHLEGRVLTRYVKFLEKRNVECSKIDEVRKNLSNLEYESSDSDSVSSDGSNIGADIYIEDITDISDGSDGEKDLNKPRAKRSSNKGFTIKRNNKGETQLHTACIAGNIILVQRLLDQGHLVNVRDNCGWLPIHEASLCGQVEIVKLLLDKGAAINDRGGTLCNGMTPLHDAASNGHLELMCVLLDNGACPLIKTDAGETPLHMLKKYCKVDQLEPNERKLYESIVERMTQILKKSGHDKDPVNNKTNTALIQDDKNTIKRSPLKRNSLLIDNLRRNIDLDDSDDDSRSSNNLSNAQDEYQMVMDNLRYRQDTPTNKRKSNNSLKRSPLLQPDEVGDDWLEDDVGLTTNKKRKLLNADGFVNSINVKTPKIKPGFLSSEENKTQDYVENFSTNSPLNTEIVHVNDNSNSSDDVWEKRPKRQVSLISAGFTRTFNDNGNTSKNFSSTHIRKHQTKLTNFTQNEISTNRASSSHHMSTNEQIKSVLRDPMLSVDVRIDDRLYRVPVPLSETHSLTIKWLAEEAVKRYCRRECMRPVIELETKNGAILAEDDLVSILFPLGNTQSEEVNARILKWNLPLLTDRYKEACTNMNISLNSTLLKLLQETSTTLDLQDMCFRNKVLSPLCKALNRQTNLQHLNLSGNFLSNDCMELLCSSLPSLENLTTLNLSLNHLNAQSMSCIADVFMESEKNILENLVSLDVSFNPLKDESLKHLAIITRYLKLRSLKLKNVEFTSDIFNNFFNTNVELCLDYLEDFDVSINRLDKEQILKFISWIKPNNVKVLDVSNNNLTEEGLTSELVQMFQCEDAKLKFLNLSACRVTDSEVYDLLKFLLKCNCKILNLSHNENLTAVSLRRLLEGCFTDLNLIGCDVVKYFENCSECTWNFDSSTIQTLKLSVDYKRFGKECEMLINMWKNKHDVCKVTKDLDNFLELSVKD